MNCFSQCLLHTLFSVLPHLPASSGGFLSRAEDFPAPWGLVVFSYTDVIGFHSVSLALSAYPTRCHGRAGFDPSFSL